MKVETDLLEEFEAKNNLWLEDPLSKICFHTIREREGINNVVVSDNYLQISVYTEDTTIYFFKQRSVTKITNKKCLRGAVWMAYVTLKSIASGIVWGSFG